MNTAFNTVLAFRRASIPDPYFFLFLRATSECSCQNVATESSRCAHFSWKKIETLGQRVGPTSLSQGAPPRKGIELEFEDSIWSVCLEHVKQRG